MVTVLVSKNIAASRLSEKIDHLVNRGATKLYHGNSSSDLAENWVTRLEYFSSDETFLKDAKSMPILGKGVGLPPPADQPWSEQAAVETFLTNHRTQLDQVIDLSQENGPFTFNFDTQGIVDQLPSTPELHQLARLLLLESKVAARTGDTAREFRAINGLLGTSIAVQGQPFIPFQLVVFTIHRMAVDQLQSAVEGNRLSDGQLAELQSRIQRLSDFQSLYQLGLSGEISNCIFMSRSKKFANPLRASWANFLRQTGLADRSAYLYLEQMESAIDIETNDLKEFSIQVRALQPSSATPSIFAVDQQISHDVLPATTAFANAAIEHAMVNRLAQLGIAVRRYEKSHAVLPAKIEDLQISGINLAELTTSSGELPKYELLQTTGAQHRAVLRSFSNRFQDVNGMEAKAVPTTTNKKTQGVDDAESPWWIWELK